MKEIKIKKSYLIIGIIIFIILVTFFLIPKFFVKSGKINSMSAHFAPEVNKVAPNIAFTTINGKALKLSDYQGEKVMLWYFATWCSSCVKGAQVLEQNNDKLNGMKVIALETFGDAGYRGISINSFVQKNVPASIGYNNWIWGGASQRATEVYNPRNYPDIYYLINEKGVVKVVDGAPSVTINKIINFAHER